MTTIATVFQPGPRSPAPGCLIRAGTALAVDTRQGHPVLRRLARPPMTSGSPAADTRSATGGQPGLNQP